MTISVATGIGRILKQEGVEWVSTFPVCKVNNALGREGIPMVMMRDDRYAVALADAFSRINAGSPIGVATFQGGVNAAGLQVAYAGMAQAYEDGSPVLCITDGVPIGETENSQFDVTSSLKSVSKWYGYLDRPERLHEFMRRAFTMLRTGRPGPVVLAIPDADALYDEAADPYAPVTGWKSLPNPADVAHAVQLLLGAQDPLIYAGEGVIYAGASAELKELAELANAPVISTLKAKGAFPEDHPLFVGVRGDQVDHYLNKCDLLLAVGSSLSPGRFSHGIPNAVKKTIIHCTVDELHVNKAYPTAAALIGDARFTLQALNKELSDKTSGNGRPPGNVAAEVKEARDDAIGPIPPSYGFHRVRHPGAERIPGLGQRLVAGVQLGRNNSGKDFLSGKALCRGHGRGRVGLPWTASIPTGSMPGLMEALVNVREELIEPLNSFVTHESGNTRDQLSTVYDTLVPRGFLGWGNVSSLGFSLAATIAAKISFPEKHCVAVTGEAGLGLHDG